MTESRQLCRQLDYEFKDSALLDTALTHRSVGSKNNERLEFLGDALLGAIVAEALFLRFPQADEGELTRVRASLVKKETLAKLARGLQLGTHIRLGEGEMKTGGWRRDSILSNTLESLIGAIFLDSDMQTCRQTVLQLYEKLLDSVSQENRSKDAKTSLQEYLQGRRLPLPAYKTIKTEGEAHQQQFTVSCEIPALKLRSVAIGNSRRGAEQAAASIALDEINQAKRNTGQRQA